MSESTPTTPTEPRASPPKHAVNYAWRLLMLIPALALIAYGYWRHSDVPPGGAVTSIRLTSKTDLSGQVRDAYAGVSPTTADFFLKLFGSDGHETKLKPFDDTPLGNGLTWTLDAPIDLERLARVEIWDDNGMLPDKQLDRIEVPFNTWEIDGQTFHIRLNGHKLEPPRWAGPLMGVGGVLAAVVLLKFVWDQAV